MPKFFSLSNSHQFCLYPQTFTTFSPFFLSIFPSLSLSYYFVIPLSLPLFFFYLCPFHDLSWPHLYSPNLSLSVPSFHLLSSFSPSLPVLSTPTYCGSCLTHQRRGGKRSMNSLWRINMQIIHTALKQICQQPTALRSLTSLSNHIGHIFSLLSLSCQWFDKGCLI